MREKDYETRQKRSLGKRVLVATLAMSMAFSGTTFAGMNTTFKSAGIAAAKTYKYADPSGDGKVDLNDAKITLKAALGIGTKLSTEQEKAADVDYSNKVDLSDAKLILQFGLGIKKVSDYEKGQTTPGSTATPGSTSVPTPTPYIPNGNATTRPSATPKTTFTPVEAKEGSTVEGMSLVVDSEASEYSNAFIENYQDNEGMYAFYDNKDNHDDSGMKVENPLAGRKEFVEDVTDVTSLEAPEGKENAWTLNEAQLEPLVDNNFDFGSCDPRIYNICSPEAVEYTVPEWTKGLTVSFWAKVKNPADPVVTFTDEDSTFILYVRANGTVKFNAEKENNNLFNMGSNSISPLGTVGEWTHYTITIANDWIGVYVNGQENIYDSTVMLRSTIKLFNKGFLTRMNPITPATEEMVNQNEHTKFYLTKIDATSTNLIQRAPWYFNTEEQEWMAHDEFTVFHNGRYRGANGSGTSIMEFLTKSTTSMFIGGVDSACDKGSCVHMFKEGAMFSDVQYFEQELTPEQIASNYEYVAKNNKPEDLDFPGENPNEDGAGTDEPIEVVSGASAVTLREKGLGVNADYDEATDTYTFKEAEANSDGEIKGVRMNNPFAAVKNGDDKSYLRSTIEEALTGQAIFPYKYPEDYADSDLAGKYVSKTHATNLANASFTGHGGCDSTSVNPVYGNFYDKYYGDVYAYGNEMTVKTGDLAADKILSLDEIEKTYTGEDVHTYQRPKWTTGVTLSFWAKPVVVDDSPLVTFYNASKENGMLLTVDTMGSVCYMSLYEAENNQGDWKSGKVLAANGEPRNTFATLGDASYVKANEWNYYTITIANDWIQVYVNGVEMVYRNVNMNRGEMKYFNNGYLTRYSPTGIYTDKMIEALVEQTGADTTGKTDDENETPRNYLIKSGYILKTTEEALESARTSTNSLGSYDVKGQNNGADSASVRMAGAYEDPYVGHTGSGLLMDLMTQRNVQMYIGGVDGALKASTKFAFSNMKVTDKDLAEGVIRAYPLEYYKEDVLTQEGANQNKIFIDTEGVLAVSADTEGAIKLGLKDTAGNDIYVNGTCSVVSTGTVAPEGAFVLQRETSSLTIESRKKIYSSDHTVKAGTKVSGMVSYYSELDAKEVANAYKTALKNKPAD